MVSLEEIRHRNKIIREYITGRTWDKNSEFLLIQKIINGDIVQNYIEKYSYIFDYEWEVIDGYTNHGKGDLVFTDAQGNFLIIECKYINLNETGKTARTKRRNNRRHIEKQVPKYINAFKWKTPDAKNVIGIGVTNEEIILI